MLYGLAEYAICKTVYNSKEMISYVCCVYYCMICVCSKCFRFSDFLDKDIQRTKHVISYIGILLNIVDPELAIFIDR